jgi:hypothetical protein
MGSKAILRILLALIAFGAVVERCDAASVLPNLFSGMQTWSEYSGELLYDFENGATAGMGNRRIDVGDVLIGSFRITRTTQGANTRPLVTSGVNEFTGVYAIQAVTKTAGGDGYTWTFAPLESAQINAISAAYTDAVVAAHLGTTSNIGSALGGFQTGSVIAFYEDPARDYGRNSVPANPGPPGGTNADGRIGTAINGTSVFQLGFTGLQGEGWTIVAADDAIGALKGIAYPGSGGSMSLGLNVTQRNPNLAFRRDVDSAVAPGNSVDASATGSLVGIQNVTTPFDGYDQLSLTVDAFYAPSVGAEAPEPATILVWLGLLGLGAVTTWWRKRKTLTK